MNILHLTLKAKWFDMIASGEKKEEYREIRPYWDKRLCGKEYAYILFRNGYSKNARSMLVHCYWIDAGSGFEIWGAESGKHYYVLRLGEIIERFDGVKA
jgi:hypothetical protein